MVRRTSERCSDSSCFWSSLSVLAGWGLTLLTHLAARNPALRMGVWLGLVIAFCYLLGLTHMLNQWTGGRLPLWEIIGGTTLGV